MIYGNRALKNLQRVICKNCKKKLKGWNDDVYTCWLRYMSGCDRKELIKGTHFTGYTSPRYYFKNHPCYKKIAKIRKLCFKAVKKHVNVSIKDYPWLLGIFYADGSKHNESQLSFSLSLNEDIIAKQIVKELAKILGKKSHIVTELIGNMINVRTHSVELCDTFPDKNRENKLKDIWHLFNKEEKLKFIGGFIDGDGNCSFQDDINSIQLFSKRKFILVLFKKFLLPYGYTSLKENSMYISPKIGLIIKEHTLKSNVKRPYVGNVNVEKALNMLRDGYSLRSISKLMDFDKKTISIALKRVYNKRMIQKFLDKNNTKLKYLMKRN